MEDNILNKKNLYEYVCEISDCLVIEFRIEWIRINNIFRL